MSFWGVLWSTHFLSSLLFIFPDPPFSFCTVSDRTQFLQTQSSCPWEKTWYNTWRRKKFTDCICWRYVYVFVAKVFVYLLPGWFLICFLNLLLIVTHFEWLVVHRSPLRRSKVTPSIALSLVRTLLCTFFGSLNLCNEAMSKHILPFKFSNLNVLRWIMLFAT